MNTFLFIIAALVAFFVVYVLWLRKWLKAQWWAQPFYTLVDPIERVLFKKSETILFARLKQLIGVLLAFLTSIGTIDITPLMPFVPDKYEPMVRAAFNLLPLVLTVMGMIDEKLRNAVKSPIEVVALPELVPPEVARAVQVAAAANAEAVAVVADAKAT